jgi:hypothetical protein
MDEERERDKIVCVAFTVAVLTIIIIDASSTYEMDMAAE